MADDDKVKITELDARCKSNTHQIDELKNDISDIRSEQKAIYDINTNIQLMTQTMGLMKTDITDVKKDMGGVKEKVNILENKPANDTYKKVDCPTAHCGRREQHFSVGAFASPTVRFGRQLQTLNGVTAHCRSLI